MQLGETDGLTWPEIRGDLPASVRPPLSVGTRRRESGNGDVFGLQQIAEQYAGKTAVIGDESGPRPLDIQD